MVETADQIQSARIELEHLLDERGVTFSTSVVENLADAQIEQAFQAVAWWDDMPHSGPRATTAGLLVSAIRNGNVMGYRRPHERTGVDAGAMPDLARSMRGVLLSPDGITRSEARDTFRDIAGRLNTPVDALIDSAVGPSWEGTPVHPGRAYAGDVATRRVRYALWISGACGGAPDPSCRRGAREDELAWGFRFWQWADPIEFERLVRRARGQLTPRTSAEVEQAPSEAQGPSTCEQAGPGPVASGRTSEAARPEAPAESQPEQNVWNDDDD